MSHIQKPLAVAVALNAAIFVTETAAGYRANSLSLIMDGIHNFSDEIALVFLFLAYRLPIRFSTNLIRSANFLNSLGLITISMLMMWQVAERIIHPAPILGYIPIIVGLASAVANWGVAQVLKKWAATSAAIHLAYIHNMGDVWVSLAPVAAGILTVMLQSRLLDPLIGLAIGLWLIWSTVKEIGISRVELLWPEQALCPHDAQPGD